MSACGPREAPACQPKRRPAFAKATAGNLRKAPTRRLEGSAAEPRRRARGEWGWGPTSREKAPAARARRRGQRGGAAPPSARRVGVGPHEQGEKMTSRTGAQILWECLVREGVTTVFGYPGGAILPAYDAMLDYPVRHVLVRHEQGATHMADGYARASGRVGVAIATSGPGATNMVTGLATAIMDSSPIVCITGQVGSRLIGSDGFQETDITGVTLPVTKHNYLVTRARDIAPAVREAFHIATTGRPGPVLVDITKDAQQSSCQFDWEAAAPRPHARPERVTDSDSIAAALDLINSAERPVILAGHGVILSDASDVVRRFAERANIPIAMTLLGIGGIPASHPLNLGMMGMHGEAWVNTAIQEADLLLAFGMRFDDRVTGNLKTYALNARKVHIDIDSAEIGKNVPVDVGLVADLRTMVETLLPGVAPTRRDDWIGRINGLKGDAAVRDIQNLPDDGHLYAAHVIHDIWRATEDARLSSRMWGSTRCGRRSTTTTRSRVRSSRRAVWARWGSRCLPPSARSWRGQRLKCGSWPAMADSR